MFLRLELVGTGANKGLDAAHAGGHGTLAENRHSTDVARTGNMRATAQLTIEAIADRHDAHLRPVFLAEEGDRAHLLRLVDAHDLGPHRQILSELLINEGLDVAELRGG